MQNLKNLGAAIVLTLALGVSAFAGPCAPPAPGIMEAPPCSAAPGQIETPPAASTAPGETSTPPAAFKDIARFAIDLLENALFF